MEILEDKENKLLGRRELLLKFNAGNGLLSRQGAVEAISTRLGVGKENVRVITLYGSSGTRDYFSKTYVFAQNANAKGQLAEYVALRHLPKDERKKAKEEKRKGTKPASGQAKEKSSATAEKKE